jgi:NET1-associated nuclear protein 1 (U3 small nucleolar RNA-associated protein 17)
VEGATLGQRQTLFQDIFGASAFSNHYQLPQNVIPDYVSTSRALPWSGNDVINLFDAPAYLMPPIETLFEPLMDSFLIPQSKQDRKHIAEGNEHDEDVDMPEQSDDEHIILEERRERIVDQREMDIFVKLFQQTRGLLFGCM